MDMNKVEMSIATIIGDNRDKQKMEEYKILANEMAEELIGSNFQPKEDKIHLSLLSEYVNSYLDYKEIDVKDDEFYIIRRNLVNRFLELINTKTEYNAEYSIDYKDYIKIWKK